MRKQTVLNPWGLTCREVDIMDEMCRLGKRQDVAKRLRISLTTCNDLQKRCYVKLGAHNMVVACVKFDRWRQGEGKGVPA